ncbi:MAG: ornithine carbamoyltransferase [Acidaminococcaceae bacterium]|jgi:ornithine carbamoyltransferase|uniref:ornithine carbamoyltransferase n=1 Tax=Succiniclasticum sp. TaxID=2775030 RepID=UPI001B09E2E8|nr:ornithine carbamoyltransferase [Succiniclasticum sp.]MBO5636489.1 ornithine carbamoyltransferase [Acidaminococcaceae bacterium]MBP3812832.1 ornithine carbamoyltransferase [Acidaminococcaceae bacterium]MBR1660759.1 ornithine carbamoyltransferase [Acidaminococcaceae bacterium]MDY6290864.1 ornithine carbamoyltransferase [Succiniclasticum sp.]
MKLKHKDLLSIHDLSTEEVLKILDVAKKLKKMQKEGVPHEFCKGQTLAMLFSKASTRTRVSFETGFHQLGGHAIYLNDKDSQIGRGEPIRDTARVLSRMVDGIMIRTFSHDSVIELAKYASIPVINGLTDLLHPCQALTDLLTIEEHQKTLEGRKLVYVGDGNNMAHSLMYACAKVGMHMVCASPKGYQPDPAVVKQAQEDAALTGCTVSVEEDIFKAVKGADVLYTDVWTSMGQEAEREVRLQALHDYQINGELLKAAHEDAIIMHCLPAHRGEEITEEVLEGPHSVVWDEAENRLHTQKAVMVLLMSGAEL